MTKQPLVSIIVPTRNSAATLIACLRSIKQQSYPAIELIVVDRYSSDHTLQIAGAYTSRIFTKGPERTAQRNFGASVAKGDYVLFIDSDMELDSTVVEQCVDLARHNPHMHGIIIPEESFGQGFWAQCKRLERSFYVGVDWIEAARFFSRTAFNDAGGYSETLVSGEDWDLSRRVGQQGGIGRITAFIHHNEGRLSLWRTLNKKYYYAQHAASYLKNNPETSKLTAQVGPIQRYKLLLSKPAKLFTNPFYGAGMLFMKTCEFGFGGAGYLYAKIKGGN